MGKAAVSRQFPADCGNIAASGGFPDTTAGKGLGFRGWTEQSEDRCPE